MAGGSEWGLELDRHRTDRKSGPGRQSDYAGAIVNSAVPVHPAGQASGTEAVRGSRTRSLTPGMRRSSLEAPSERGPVPDTQLPVRVRQVELHCLDAEEQAPCDLLVGVSLRHGVRDLELLRRELDGSVV